MYSRAHLLIEQEIEKVLSERPWGVELWPLYEDSMFEWMAKIKGLKGTDWEDGVFKIYVKFDEHYNVRPPQVYFQTIPFHPNVEVNSGKPSVEFLDNYEKWSEKYSLIFILTSLQFLLANPDLSNRVNPEAAQMLQSSPQSYHQMVLECVAASKRVEEGGSPHIIEATDAKVRFANKAKDGARTATRTAPNRILKLSFDDYHTTWCGIGTSKTNPNDTNPLLESIKHKEKLQEIHIGLPREEVKEQMRKQMEDHNILMYGKIQNKQPGVETARREKLAQMERMKKIYLPPRQSPLPPQKISVEAALPELQLQGREDTKDGWENEVDDLVQWTNNLDSNGIDGTS